MTDCVAEMEQTIDPRALRKAFGTFVTGVTVITTHDDSGNPRGMTANSFTSVSLDPPLLLVCVGRNAACYSAFSTTESFAVNLLHERQAETSAIFASKTPDKFASVSYDRIHSGAPILSDCLSWFDCTVHHRVEAGDHLVLIGRVRAFGTTPSAPLGFCRGQYASVKDPLPKGWMASHSMVVGYLIDADGHILLRSTGEEEWTLPNATTRRASTEPKLEGAESLLLKADETFLYSVFDTAEGDPGHLVYRARLTRQGIPQLPPGFRFFRVDEIPYGQILSREIRALLGRYARERQTDRFSIYVDSGDGGRLAMVDGTSQAWSQLHPES